jgi:hypothetical protein
MAAALFPGHDSVEPMPLVRPRRQVQKGRHREEGDEEVSDERFRSEAEREPTLVEVVDLGVRRVSTAIIVAGVAIAIGVYASSTSPPRFQAISSPEGIVRIDTRKGTILACKEGQCMLVVESGQHLESRPKAKALPSPAAAPEAAAPAALPPPSAPAKTEPAT